MASFFPTSTTECYVTKHVRNSEILENNCFEYGDADVAGPRCRFAVEQCAGAIPPLESVGDGHHAACWVADQVAEQERQAS